jgi:hypothetical protein
MQMYSGKKGAGRQALFSSSLMGSASIGRDRVRGKHISDRVGLYSHFRGALNCPAFAQMADAD